MKKIALCGFMGCGKSTIARLLKSKYSLEYVDTDEYVEKQADMKISDIFKNFGEECFRDKEYDAISTLSSENIPVLSLGGGAVMKERNVKKLKENGYTIVFLNTSLETIKERVKNDPSRPLFDNNVNELYKKRMPIYSSVCDINIDCDSKSADEVADEIIKMV